MLSKIYFTTNQNKLKEMAYGDSIYAWLLLHSHFNPDEDHNYIYKNEFTYEQIGQDIHRTRQTVSKRFKELLNSNEGNNKDLIFYDEYNKVYVLPCFRDFEQLNADTVLNLFWLYGQGNKSRKEELIKTYAWLKKQIKQRRKDISYEDLLEAFGHAKGNEQTYQRYKEILTVLQGAGLIRFRTDSRKARSKDGKFEKTFYVYQVNDKASQEWIDKKRDE